MVNLRRRDFLARVSSLMVCAAVTSSEAGVTPPQSLGPFYPSKFPLDSDADLTSVRGKKGRAVGHITNLFGQVFSVDGSILSNAEIEIWQCDAFGAYHHPRDGGGIDPFFQGYGKAITDEEGRYRFKTIKPVSYPGRAPHIHVRVVFESKQLVTQIYVQGDPVNDNDFLLNSIHDEAAIQSLVIPFKIDPAAGMNELVAIFNPVIG